MCKWSMAIVLTKDSENRIDGSGSNAEENRAMVSDGGTVVAKRGVIDTEIELESMFDEKDLVVSFSSTGDGAKDVSGGIVDGVSYEENESKKSDKSSRNSIEVYRDGIGRWNGEKLEDGNHGYREGDLVWAKVKNYPWWPGQIYDPRDASEFAVKHSQEGRLLVAFFGDGSCSWCLPSQVVPFIENFNQMSSNEEDSSSSKSVLNAVQKAVDEVGRVVESRLTCKCIQKKDHLARPVVANAGVKAGVFVPEVDIDRFRISEYEPDEILTKVANLAKGVSVGNTFELGILKSSLSAFRNAKSGHPLPVYNETALTTDLNRNGTKQRSVAETMTKRNGDEPKRKKKSVNGSSPKRLKTAGGEMEERSSNGPSATRKTRGQTRRESDERKAEIENAKSKYSTKPEIHVTFVDEMPDAKELTGQQKRVGGSRKRNGLVVGNGKRLSFSKSDINIAVNELSTEIESTAVDPFFSSNKVWGFVSAFRSATFVQGSDHGVYQKSIGNECAQLISDVGPIKVKFDIIIEMLKRCSTIPSEEKESLEDKMKRLMGYVETASKPHRI